MVRILPDMTIFAVLMPAPQPQIAAAIQAAYPDDHLSITDTQWLISGSGTAIDVTAKIGVYDSKNPEKPAGGSAIIIAMAAYYGRAPTPVWDWIKAKQESSPHG
jgi:hypothetical protein